MTVTEWGGAVLIGGYLVLNCLGRPLEFHCTEPVKPNRAQEILYGPTLRGFLGGEQIGQALLTHCQLKPELVLTDTDAILSLRDFTDIPVLGVQTNETVIEGDRWVRFCLGTQRVYIDSRYAADQHRIEQIHREQLCEWDLAEPFERIREAVSEMQKAA